MPSLQEDFGAMVRHHRERLGLTQAELAEKSDRSLEMIGRIERGSASPSFDTIEALSAALKTPVRDFFGVGTHSVGARSKLGILVAKLARLAPDDLAWIDRVIAAALSKGA